LWWRLVEQWPTRSTALVFAALLSIELRDDEGLHRYVEAVGASEQRDGEVRAVDVSMGLFTGYLDVVEGRREAGFARMRRALDESSRTEHAPGLRAIAVRLLLEACSAAADSGRGLWATAFGLRTIGRERLWEAEIHRLRAEFLAEAAVTRAEVEAELSLALEVARRQGARALELRAAASLLRYRRRSGDHQPARDARRLLATVVEALPEAADTADGREASSMLAET
jgi:hypothetical protein